MADEERADSQAGVRDTYTQDGDWISFIYLQSP